MDLKLLLIVAFLSRAILLFAVPNLSDDYFRFIWDGKLMLNHVNPFEFLPIDLSKTAFYLENRELIKGMNSPEYYSIYPPALQAIFYISSLVSFNSFFANIFILKFFIFLFEIGNVYLLFILLKRFTLPTNRVFLYALNPLVIIELTGNIHFEAGMIFFTLLCLSLMLKSKLIWAAISLSFAVLIKLIPLLFLPAIFFYYGFKKGLIFSTIVFISVLLFSFPFFNSIELIQNFFSSFQLYFQKFEFNAGIYNVFRRIGFHFTGYNQIAIIGKITSFIVLISILLISIKDRNFKNNLPEKLFWSLFIYLSFASIVHPWYLCPLVALGVFTSYRFIYLWSGLAALSYFAYSNPLFKENYYLLAIEYFLVGLYLIYEFNNKKVKSELFKST